MNIKMRIRSLIHDFKKRGITPPGDIIPDLSLIGALDEARAIQSLWYHDLHYPNDNYFQSTRSYIRMVNVAYHLGCKNILELGSGISTALWARFAERTGSHVSSINTDFGPVTSATHGTKHYDAIFTHIDLIQGITVSADELRHFYKHKPHDSLGNVDVIDFISYLDLFLSSNCPPSSWNRAVRVIGKRHWSVRDLIIQNTSLYFSSQLLDSFSTGGDFDNEIRFLLQYENKTTGILDRFIDSGKRWDFVFFDSGELSSIIEWIKVKDFIVSGGIAAFHDIFFPKSFKNFIVCASLIADPEWKIVFIDDTLKQGLLLAQKQR